MKHGTSHTLVRRLARGYLRPHIGKLAVSVVCMVVVAVATAAITYLVKPIMDEIFLAGNREMLYLIPAALIGIYVVKGVANYLQSFLMEYTGQRLVADLQIDLFGHVINHDTAFFQKESTSGLISRFLFDLHRLKQAVSQTITGTLRDATTVVGLIAVMFIQDWQLSLIALTAFPLVVFPIVRFGRHMRRYAVGQQEEMGRLTAILKEGFGHNRQVKTYTMEEYESARAATSVNRVFTLMVKAARVRALSSPVMELLGGFSMAFIIMYGGSRVMNGVITTGAFFSFLTALMSLYRPIKGLANINNVLQEGLAAADRAFRLMDTAPRVVDAPDATPLTVKKGEVRFENVCFAYETEGEEQEHAVDHVNFTIPAGQTVAIVGPSGAGKSTVLNLIPRFFDPTGGRILIDGTDITKTTLASLRAHIALVTQEVAIFDDTVAANIAYGRPEAAETEIQEAAKAASAHEFIMGLPNGYNTRLGEDGTRLSGGQRQRIAIARAILKNAPILLLDEATSNLDTESERQVQDALTNLMKGRTTLVVAHRLSTIVNADHIYVMENGKILEQGTHGQLVEKENGAYNALYKLQTGSR